MRKLKYILASMVLAATLVSCGTEPVDETVKDDSLPGSPILSFNYNGTQTVTSNEVSIGIQGDGLMLVANLSILADDTSNPETRYKPATLYIQFSNFSVGYFPTAFSADNPGSYICTANLYVQERDEENEKVTVLYSTNYAEDDENGGYSNITAVNASAKFVHGNFNLTLYPDPDITDLNVTKKNLSVGTFSYINY